MTTEPRASLVEVTQADRNLVKTILGETTHTNIGYKIDRGLAFTAEVEAAARHRLEALRTQGDGRIDRHKLAWTIAAGMWGDEAADLYLQPAL